MNLVSDPWIPVLQQDKSHALVGLRALFAEGENIADISVNPCQRIALMRLLVCITQAALDGPADDTAWRTARSNLANLALAYLNRWQYRFNLFGQDAFLQAHGVEATPNAITDKIDFALSAGNNATLFDHAASPEGRLHGAAALAMNLLVYQQYSPGGLIGAVQWGGTPTDRTSEHAPCLEGSMLHTRLRGATILDSIHLNLLTRAQVESLANTVWGTPNWELSPMSKANLEANAKGYLARLVPMPRAIRCFEDSPQLVLAAGSRYAKFPEQREVSATIVEIGTGAARRPAYLAVNTQKHPWRELASILVLRQADNAGGALCLANLRNITAPTFDIWTGGMAADKSKLLDMAEWSMTLDRHLLDDTALTRYATGVELANKASGALGMAVKNYAETLKADAATWRAAATRSYWTYLDQASSTLANLANGEDESLRTVWVPTLRAAMLNAYSYACPSTTPRQIQAFAIGLKPVESWNPDR